ncbi:MAG: sugar ABC transporter permease [Lachnospiraceae bacterium]|nr:sugar ABC transporter permease [Lachnospiraceae bacterium]
MKKSKIKYRDPLMPKTSKIYGFIGIPVAIYVFIMIIPTFVALFYSFFKWSGGPRKKFIGFENYIRLFQDQVFWDSLGNTLIFTLIMVIGQIGIAFLFTMFFTMKWLKWVEFHRRVMYLPSIIAPVVIGLLWQIIYNQQYGLLNQILKALGLEHLIQPWLDDPKIALFSVCIPVIWQFVGYYLVIMMGAVATIPKDVLEVAEIDGASGFQRTIYITIPMIWNTLKICLMMCIAGSLKAFDHIMVMTGGGPGRATTVVSLYNYETSFTQMKLGYANAMAVVILVISMAITIGAKVLMGGKKHD